MVLEHVFIHFVSFLFVFCFCFIKGPWKRMAIWLRQTSLLMNVMWREAVYSVIAMQCSNKGKKVWKLPQDIFRSLSITPKVRKCVLYFFLFTLLLHNWSLFEVWILFFSFLELHIFEVHVTYSIPGWLHRVFKSVDEFISKAWHNSAFLLLNRLFEKWEPSNQEAMKTFTQLISQFQLCFLSARERVFYNYNLSAPLIKVSESF